MIYKYIYSSSLQDHAVAGQETQVRKYKYISVYLSQRTLEICRLAPLRVSAKTVSVREPRPNSKRKLDAKEEIFLAQKPPSLRPIPDRKNGHLL
jgi:hypothetical protein